eukprot:TRINITY_DN64664_c0_g1_i1.p1 TRINITY_DN64664_c0_g1~~TRINITY_DN64664_c0_g1_i1.p1  ORF type:complete len:149 (+),score=22.43 TRINITY_DN64664_c0_g1_i1:116-562(+)
MIRRPPRSTLSSSSAASDVYKRQCHYGNPVPALCMVQCVENDLIGHFMFPTTALKSNKIASNNNGAGGKLAFRVYPPWVTAESKQAATVQKWQCQYFIFDTDAVSYKNIIHSYLDIINTSASVKPIESCEGHKQPVLGSKRPRSIQRE